MTKKTMIIILIFVVIAGAIAGAFVFLNQGNVSGPATLPSGTVTGGATRQGMLPHGFGGAPETVFSISLSGSV